MTGLPPRYWLLAGLLALATHLAAILVAVELPLATPALRGGGLFDNGTGRFAAGDGIVVRLGPPRASAPPAAPPPVPPRSTPETAAAPPPVASPAAPPVTPPATPPVTPPTARPATPPVAAPATGSAEPAPKPDRPAPPPVRQAAPPPAPAPAPPTPAPSPPAEAARQAARQAATQITTGVTFGPDTAQRGTASGNETGAVRRPTYGDRVMLWLQAHGEYPLQAARYGLKDTVTVEFSINRHGDILYYRLVRESRWYLLNTAVREMMARSSPVPPFPPGIADDELTFTVPVTFSPP